MDDHIEELFPLYALGALSDEERSQVESYVATRHDARARLALQKLRESLQAQEFED